MTQIMQAHAGKLCCFPHALPHALYADELTFSGSARKDERAAFQERLRLQELQGWRTERHGLRAGLRVAQSKASVFEVHLAPLEVGRFAAPAPAQDQESNYAESCRIFPVGLEPRQS